MNDQRSQRRRFVTLVLTINLSPSGLNRPLLDDDDASQRILEDSRILWQR